MSAGVNNDYSTSTVQQRSTKDSSERTSIDFLTLLVTQLSNQDPLNPMEDLDFTAQLAQLEALEQQIELTASMNLMLGETQMQSATAMIGKTVTGLDDYGTQVTGVGASVSYANDKVYVVLGSGQKLQVANVTGVADGTTSLGGDIAVSSYAIGMWVEAGLNAAMQPIQGIVEKVSVVNGEVVLDLYGGETVAWNQVTSMRVPTEQEQWYVLPDAVREKVETAQGMLGLAVKGQDPAGNDVSGIVANASLIGSDVYLVLYDGTYVNLDTVKDDPAPPTAEEAMRDLAGLYASGVDVDGLSATGRIVGAEDTEDGLLLTLEGGTRMYYDHVLEISDGTDVSDVSGA